MAHTPPITADIHAIVTTSPQIAKAGTPIYDDLAAQFTVGDRVDTEYEVLVAQAVMDLIAGRTS